MEIVTLAQVVLNRIGSASQRGVVAHREVAATRQVPDASEKSLMELVKTIAEENGEQRDRLDGLALSKNPSRHSPPRGALVFDVHTPNVQYSSPYAICAAFPALKADGQFYKLEEVKV